MRDYLTHLWVDPKDAYVDVDMGAPVTKPALDALLTGLTVGTWVVLDPGMSKILGAASTLEQAMQKAAIPPGLTGGPDPKRPVVLQVQDPTIACFY